jgi:hypothetical protein
MFLALGIIAFIIIAFFLPRFALVVFVTWAMNSWVGPWMLLGAIVLAIIALIIDILFLKRLSG